MRRPAGRRPAEDIIALSSWFNGLSESDRQMVGRALKQVAGSAIFGFCCILDGVRPIEDLQEKGELELFYVTGEVKVRLNDPQREELHNLLNGFLHERPANS